MIFENVGAKPTHDLIENMECLNRKGKDPALGIAHLFENGFVIRRARCELAVYLGSTVETAKSHLAKLILGEKRQRTRDDRDKALLADPKTHVAHALFLEQARL